jgi:spermidine synthase
MSRTSQKNPPRRMAMALWALSGLATLTLELLWMRQAALWAGNTVTAAVLVTAVFFLAAAMGNLMGGQLSASRRRPLLVYAVSEALAGGSALLGHALAIWLRENHGIPAFLAVLALAAPASFFSGIAFPCLAAAFSRGASRRVADIAPLYASNLLGAACGVAAGGVLLPFWLGMKTTLVVAAALQLSGGLLALRLAAWLPQEVFPEKSTTVSKTPQAPLTGWLLLAASGLLALSAQSLLLVWARQIWEGSLYTAAAVLAVFIGGLGLGALAAGAWRRKGKSVRSLLVGYSVASALLLMLVPHFGTALSLDRHDLQAATPPGMLGEAIALCALVLLPLCFCLGGIFPLAWELAGLGRRADEGWVIARASALNKLASSIGAAAGLFLLQPAAGLAHATLWIATGYALIAASMRRRALWLAVPVGLAFWLAPPPPGIRPGLRLIATEAGAYGPVSVVEETSTGSRQILLNSRQRLSGTQAALSSQKHQSWLPLMLCRQPDRVLTIGMAAGISAAAALDFPIHELHAVELVPEVAAAARKHFGPWNEKLFSDPRARVIIGDGRAELVRSEGCFDAIILDLLFPAEEGTAGLYSRDFLRQARQKLAPGGVCCIWLPCYQLTPQTAGIVVRTFLEAFPHAIAVRANFDPLAPVVGLVGASTPIPFSSGHFAARLGGLTFPDSPFLRTPDHALLMLAGDLHAAVPPFGGFPVTSDDAPVFAFLGPRQPRGKERLYGFPFLDWIGKRFPDPGFPSLTLTDTSAAELHAHLRAANFYQAAASASLVMEGDSRPPGVRERQIRQYLGTASQLAPRSVLQLENLGR